MKRVIAKFVAATCVISVAYGALAEEAKEELKEEESKLFEAGIDFDFFSAYVWRNAVQNDDMVMQPCVWADFTYFEPFWLGFSIWQNYDITNRRHEMLHPGLTETDYNVHIGATPWSSEDESMSIDLELGHEWFDNQRVRSDYKSDYHDTAEIYAKATFHNPIVDVYGQISSLYRDFGEYKSGMSYEVGFTREIELTDSLTLGADWNVNFGDKNYLYFLYGGVNYEDLDDDGEDDVWNRPDAGFAGTTVKLYLSWAVTDWMSLVGTIAYTGVINDSARDELKDSETFHGDTYRRDLLWGGVSLKIEY